MTARKQFLALFAFAAVLLTTPLFFRDLWTPDEPRYALVAREMLWSGEYIAPTRNGEAYLEKPPLLFWAIAAASAPFGDVSAITARVPSVLAALLTLGLTFSLARRLYNERIAALSVAILATGYRFWWQAQFGEIDMLLCACMTASLYALYRHRQSPSVGWLALFYCGIALGLLAKGPPALVFSILGALAFHWRDPQGRKTLKLWIGVPATIGVFLLWFIPARSGLSPDPAAQSAADSIVSALRVQIVDRVVSATSHARPPWYYLENLPLDWFPWSLFAPWMFAYFWKIRREDARLRILFSWTLPALIFFSLISGKRAVYLVPIYPAIAILSAVAIASLVDNGRSRWLLPISIAWMGFTLAAAAAPFAVLATSVADVWSPRLLVLTAVAVACFCWSVVLARVRAWRHFPVALAAQLFILSLPASAVVIPAVNTLKTSRPFCSPVRTLVAQGEVNVFTACFVREEYVFYSNSYQTPVLFEPGREALESRLGIEEASNVSRRARELLYHLPSTNQHDESARAGLPAAFENALQEAGVPSDLVGPWAEATARETAKLESAFHLETPAVLFVTNNDWDWIQAFIKDLSVFTVIEHEAVTTRDMILMGNPAAIRMLGQVDNSRRVLQDSPAGSLTVAAIR